MADVSITIGDTRDPDVVISNNQASIDTDVFITGSQNPLRNAIFTGEGTVSVLLDGDSNVIVSGTASASSDTASNLGIGSGIFYQKTLGNFEFKSLRGGTNIDISGNNNELILSFTGIAGGDVTTADLTGASGALQISIDANDLDITDLKVATGHLHTETLDLISATGTLRSDIDSNDTDISNLQTATGTLRTDVDSNDADIADLQSATGTLSTVSGALRTDISSNDSDITELQGATGTLRADIDSNDTDISNLQTATGTLSTEIDNLETATGTLRSDIDSNDTEIADLKTATGTLRSDIDSNDTDIADLQTSTGYLDTNKSELTVTGSSVIVTPDLSGAGTVAVYRDGNNNVYISGSSSASTDTASNLGIGSGIFFQKVAGNFEFKSLVAGPNITITGNNNELYISGGGGGAGASTVKVTGSSAISDPNFTGVGLAIVDYDGTYIKISGQIDPTTNELVAATGYLNTELIANDAEIADLKTATGTLRSDIDSNDTDIADLQSATGTLSTVSGALRTDVDQNTTDITDLQSATGTLSTVSGALRTDVNTNTSDITELKTASGYLNTEIQSNDSEIADLKTATGTLRTDVDSNDVEIADLKVASGYLNNAKSAVTITGSSLLPNADFTGAGNVAIVKTANGVLVSGSTSASSDTAANLGVGSGWFVQKVGGQFEFKSVIAGPNIAITGNAQELYISGSAGGGSSIQVTGSSAITDPNFTGVGLAVVDYDGTYVRISGIVDPTTNELVTATGYLNTEIQANDVEITDLKVATGSLEGRISTNTTDITDLQSATGYLNTEIQSNDTEIADLKTATGTLSTVSGALRTDISSNDTDISALQAVTGDFVPRSDTGFLAKEITGASYTVTAADANHYIRTSYTGLNGTGYVDITIPDNILTSGNQIYFIQGNTGQINLITGDGMIFNYNGLPRSRGLFSALSLTCIEDTAGAYQFDLVGDLDSTITIDDIISVTGEFDTGITNLETATGYLNNNKSEVSVTGSNVIVTPDLSGLGNVSVIRDGDNSVWISGSTSASSDTASNLGGGSGVFAQKAVGDFQFKSLVAGPNIAITGNANELFISGGGGGGSSNFKVTGSNNISDPNVTGIGEVEVFYDGTYVLISGTAHTAGGGSDVSVTGSNTISSPDLTGLGTVTVDLDGAGNVRISGVASASSDTASNVGTGSGIFAQKSAGDFKFKSLVAGSNVSILGDTGSLTISASISGVSGQESLYADAGAMVPSGATPVSNGPNDLKVDYLLFDGAVEESVFFKFMLGDDWDKGNVNLQIVWDGASGAAADDWVQWDVKAAAISEDDSWWNTELGGLYSGNDQLTVTGDIHTLQINNITITGNPANDDVLVFKLSRNPSPTGSPSMAEDALLFGARVLYNSTYAAAGGSSTGSSTLKVTGSAAISEPNFTGVGLAVVDYNGTYVRVSGQVDPTTTELVTATGYLNTEIQSNDTEIADLKTATGTLRSDVDSNDTDIADLQSATGTLSTVSGALRTDVDQNATDITDLQSATGTLSTVSGALRTDVDQNATDITDLQSATGTLSTVSGALRTDVDQNTTDITDLKTASGYLDTNKSEVSVTGSAIILTPDVTGAGTVSVTYDGASQVLISGTAGASSDTASNLGIGSGVFFQKNGADFEFKSLVAGPNIAITGNNDELYISGSAGGGGGSDVQVTGSSNIATANFTGLGLTTVDYNGTYVRISGQVDPTTTELVTASGYLNTEIQSNDVEIADLKTATGTLRTDIDNNDVEIAELITASGYLNSEIQSNDVEIADLKTATGTLSTVSGALRTDVDQNTTDITDLQSATGTLSTVSGALRTDVDQNATDITDLQSATGTLSTVSGALRTDVDQNATDITDLQTASGYLDTNKSEVSATGSATILTPDLTGIGTVTVTYDGASQILISGTAGSSSDTASNVGTGSGVFAQKVAGDFQFKSLTAGSNISIDGDTGSLTISAVAVSGVSGQKSLYIDAGGMVPSGAEPVTSGPNNLKTDYFLFDGTIEESVFFKFALEDDWNKGNVDLQIVWDGASGASANDWTQWDVRAAAISDNDSWWNTALGGLHSGNDQLYVTGDSHVLEINNITIAGNPANDDLLVFKLSRNPSPTGSPSMAEDALLFGVRVLYNSTAASVGDNSKFQVTGSAIISEANVSGIGTVTVTYDGASQVLISGTAGASSDTASNLGIGSGVFFQKNGADFEFKSLVAGPNIAITGNNNELYISGSAGGVGGGSDVQVTGSSNLSTANFTGVGLTTVDYNGTYVRVSGQVDPTTNELVTATGYLDTNKLANIVEDLTPQLGGNLEVLDNKITGMVYLHSSGGMIMALGDNTGLNTISIRDSFGTEKISLSSSGEILLNEIHNPVRIQSLIGGTKILEITSNGIEMAASHNIVMQAGDLVDGRDVSVDGALLDKLDTASGYLNTEIQANDVEIADLKTATGTLSTVSGALRTDVDANTTNITDLQTATGTLRVDLDELSFLKAITIETPASGDNITMFHTNKEIHIIGQHAMMRGTTLTGVGWNLYYSTGRINATANTVGAGGYQVTNEFTGLRVTDIATVSASSFVWVELTGVNGETVDEFSLSVYYTGKE